MNSGTNMREYLTTPRFNKKSTIATKIPIIPRLE
jgi:hypothetical protein